MWTVIANTKSSTTDVRRFRIAVKAAVHARDPLPVSPAARAAK